MVKKLPANAGDARDRVGALGLEDPLEEELAAHSSILWRRKRQPTPVFLPGEFHGQKSLAGYSSRDRKSQTQLGTIFLSFQCSFLGNPMDRGPGGLQSMGSQSQRQLSD